MSRDTSIENIFLVADDAIQGLWGLHTFTNAAVNTADRARIMSRLPTGAFQLTHEWARLYNPEELTRQMDLVFEFVHCRNSLVLLVSLFEGAILRFNEQLRSLPHVQKHTTYKPLLKWIFGLVRDTQSGSPAMRKRLPETCGEIDNARRLRNCFAHNNGRYNRFYLDDAIQDKWVSVRPHGSNLIADVDKREKILVINDHLEGFIRSHIEVLHVVHNTIQRKFFGESQDYSYAAEGKQIEWHRILSGETFLRM